MLRGRRDRYHRFGLLIPLTFAAIATPIQIGVGDWIANIVAENQPVKLAAMEGLYDTGRGVPLSLGGIYLDDELHCALEIPWGLSLLVTHDPNGEVIGLESVPPDLRPPVNVVHLAYNVMVGIGSALLLLALWLGWTWWRTHRIPRLAVVPARVGGLRRGGGGRDGGGLDHHRGRPPAVHRLRRPAHRRRREPGARPRAGLLRRAAIYAVLTVLTVFVLRRLGPLRTTWRRRRNGREAGAGDARGGRARRDVRRAHRLRAVRRRRLRRGHLGPAGRRHPPRRAPARR